MTSTLHQSVSSNSFCVSLQLSNGTMFPLLKYAPNADIQSHIFCISENSSFDSLYHVDGTIDLYIGHRLLPINSLKIGSLFLGEQQIIDNTSHDRVFKIVIDLKVDKEGNLDVIVRNLLTGQILCTEHFPKEKFQVDLDKPTAADLRLDNILRDVVEHNSSIEAALNEIFNMLSEDYTPELIKVLDELAYKIEVLRHEAEFLLI